MLAQQLRLKAADGAWTVGGSIRDDLAGCVDVDLGFSPSTNTLPARRLDLSIGQVATIEAAWVTFPDFNVKRQQQRYERLDDRRWRYQSGDFSADLVLDEHKLVRRYGVDIWVSAAEPGR